MPKLTCTEGLTLGTGPLKGGAGEGLNPEPRISTVFRPLVSPFVGETRIIVGLLGTISILYHLGAPSLI